MTPADGKAGGSGRAELLASFIDATRRSGSLMQLLSQAAADRIGVLNGGRLVAEGTSEQLKRMVPGGHVVLRLAGPDGLDAAARVLPVSARDDEALTLQVPSDGGVRSLRALLGRLEDEAIEVEEFSVHTPDLDDVFLGRANTLFSDSENIRETVTEADLVVGAVLIPGAAAPKLVSEALIKQMSPGSVVVDVAVDQGGCIETCKPTTHDNPTFEKHGVIHYCVANMPGAVPRTSTFALTNVTQQYMKLLADKATDKLLGAHIIGPDAGTLIAELATALEFGASAEDVARTCHAHPSLPEAVKEAALAVAGRALHV